MSNAIAVQPESNAKIVADLVEIGELDTLYRDLYLERARELMETVLPRDSYNYIKDSVASLGLAERQLRTAVQRGDWKRTAELTTRISSIKKSSEKREKLTLAETVYDKLADIPLDRFAPGFYTFFDLSGKGLEQARARAMGILSYLQTTDPTRNKFYERRRSDLAQLQIEDVAEEKTGEKVEAAGASLLDLRQQALTAVDAGDLSQLDEILKQIAEAEMQDIEEESGAVELGEAAELGDDLVYEFTDDTLASAKAMGMAKVRTQSRRHFSYLLPYGWHPSFLKSESKKWAKEQFAQLAHPADASDQMREAVELYLFNPFINSGGTRYQVCLVAEDLLMEDFDEPEPRADMPDSALLGALGLKTRWGLTRVEIERALMEHGPDVLRDQLGLDPESFRLVIVPPDIFTLLGRERGWGKREMWTHFDGYWLRDGGMQALAGGDVRFGGTHDIVSFSTGYSNDKLLVRFAVVQRKRMMSWQKN